MFYLYAFIGMFLQLFALALILSALGIKYSDVLSFKRG